MFSSGMIPSGGEQFLPLFYDNLETLFDYCENSKILIHNDIIELFDERSENLNDYFEARNNSKDSFFLKPDNLFIDKNYFEKILSNFSVTKLSLFNNEGDNPINLKKINNISSIRESIDFDFIKKCFDINSASKKIIRHYGPIIAGNQIILASSDGFIRFYNPETGEQITELKIKNGATTNPIVVDKTLYLITQDGNLRAFRWFEINITAYSSSFGSLKCHSL